MLRHVSALTVGHLQGALKIFLACSTYAPTYLVGILHIIKIIIIILIIIIINVMTIKCHSSLKSVLWLKYS